MFSLRSVHVCMRITRHRRSAGALTRDNFTFVHAASKQSIRCIETITPFVTNVKRARTKTAFVLGLMGFTNRDLPKVRGSVFGCCNIKLRVSN